VTEDLAARLAGVRQRIRAACDRSGRDASGVRLIAVTKGHGPDAVVAAWRAGVRDFGENRVQEASSKVAALRAIDVSVRWHLVGHLQRNKVRAARDRFDIIHSVDSRRLADALSDQAPRTVPVLIEVNVGGEESKFGMAPADAPGLAAHIANLPGLDLVGLMTVAPQADNPDDVRHVFRRLRELRDAIGLRELSMGMTDDFETAIEEGATIVRVGRAIFGPR
jgi:pyridoxal phosphate enzyme (YggS family)